MKLVVRRARRSDSPAFLRLLSSLARFEKLREPSRDARRRIVKDIFDRHIAHLLVATLRGKVVGYALYFYAYSSFLARPTLYLEDVFVAEGQRGYGVGGALFDRCCKEAVRKECGRMEWAVLGWNAKAIQFYEERGAKRMDDWRLYRLDGDDLRRSVRSAGQIVQKSVRKKEVQLRDNRRNMGPQRGCRGKS